MNGIEAGEAALLVDKPVEFLVVGVEGMLIGGGAAGMPADGEAEKVGTPLRLEPAPIEGPAVIACARAGTGEIIAKPPSAAIGSLEFIGTALS